MRRLRGIGAIALGAALAGIGVAQAIGEPMMISRYDMMPRSYELKKSKYKSKCRRRQARGW